MVVTLGLSVFLSDFPLLQSSPDVVLPYSEIFVQLRKRGQMIGPNDLWIAAVARVHQLPILTRNSTEFRRVDDVEVIDYTERSRG